MTDKPVDAERQRVVSCPDGDGGWRRFGPYLADRSWGTVREDYSANGNAWAHLPYRHARSKAFRWGEDGIAGWSDRYQRLCFAPAFFNGNDDHLKERFFGVDPYEGNHGEDVKEYYFHVDNVPTHSYCALRYFYPQQAFPYADLVAENQRRQGQGPEYELLDTKIFDDNRYFDVLVEYGKFDEEDWACRITVENVGPEAANIVVVPQVWFRNTWSWGPVTLAQPRIEHALHARALCMKIDDTDAHLESAIPNQQAHLGVRHLYCAQHHSDDDAMFCDNETNAAAVFGAGHVSKSRCPKDAINDAVVHGDERGLRVERYGTKAAFVLKRSLAVGAKVVIRLRCTPHTTLENPLGDVDSLLQQRRAEADDFYAHIHPVSATADEKHVQRRALAGLLWTKQSYIFDVAKWLDGDNPDWPPPAGRGKIRNGHWRHLNTMRIMSMPDKWEYPWFAAWDLAFHAVPFALVDAGFAKEQLWMLLFEQFQHPSGQLPAYEWEFSDLNPPVHAWAVWRVYNMDRLRNGHGDRAWLEKCFHKLLINFASWVNKVDREGNNVFEGGFLGLDNITVLDRSSKPNDGATLEQSDATGWMGMFCLNLMRIALELAKENSAYEGLASKFFQHYIYVAYAMKHMGQRDYSLFDTADGFFYDVLRYPNGTYKKLRLRSLVGLIPLFAVERLELDWIKPFKEFNANVTWFLRNRREMAEEVVHTLDVGGKTTLLLTIVNQQQLKRMLSRMHDESEFLSRYGIRSLSKVHDKQPFVFNDSVVAYEPAESSSKLKGGNSNWRGPLWFPTTFLLIESLRKLGTAFGPQLQVNTPAAGGPIEFRALAKDVARRMIDIFLRDSSGKRPVFGGAEKFQQDPRWRDEILFYEHFHGDNGAGLGASHQTGWTALVANLIDEWPR
jgi:hypothetical protein